MSQVLMALVHPACAIGNIRNGELRTGRTKFLRLKIPAIAALTLVRQGSSSCWVSAAGLRVCWASIRPARTMLQTFFVENACLAIHDRKALSGGDSSHPGKERRSILHNIMGRIRCRSKDPPSLENPDQPLRVGSMGPCPLKVAGPSWRSGETFQVELPHSNIVLRHLERRGPFEKGER